MKNESLAKSIINFLEKFEDLEDKVDQVKNLNPSQFKENVVLFSNGAAIFFVSGIPPFLASTIERLRERDEARIVDHKDFKTDIEKVIILEKNYSSDLMIEISKTIRELPNPIQQTLIVDTGHPFEKFIGKPTFKRKR